MKKTLTSVFILILVFDSCYAQSPQGSLTANGPLCTSGTGQLTWTATAGTAPYSIVYNDGIANRTISGVNSGTPFNVVTEPVTSTTTYTLVSVTDATRSETTSGFTSGSATITVNPTPQGTLTANQPFCGSGTGELTFISTDGTAPFTLIYNDGVANRTQTGVTSGTPFNVYTEPIAATTTYTLISVAGSGCTRSSAFTGSSATIVINTPVTPALSISSGAGTSICIGQTVYFNAIPTNGGNTPTYQWLKNNADVGTNSATYQDNALTNNDIISCVLTSSATCVSSTTANSNNITITTNVTTPISITISSGSGTSVCTGADVTFTANTTDISGSPIYQWTKNGYDVGTNAATYTDGALVNNDVINCMLTSYATCASPSTANSNSLAMNVGTCVSTWTGGSTTWTDPSNWSNNIVPSSCSNDVVIPSGRSNYPVLTTDASVGNLTINDGASINLQAQTLTVCGNLTGGTGGTATITGGVVSLTGTSPQTLGGSLTADNLEIANTSTGVTASGTLSINKSLVMTQGNFTNNGTVTLVSGTAGDAYYDDFTSSSAGTYNGNMSVQRYISNNSLGYYDLSSPVNTTVGNLGNSVTISGANAVDCWYSYNPYPNVQKYVEDMSLVNGAYYERWVSYTGTSNMLWPMLGVAVRLDYSAELTNNPLTLTGTPNTGNQSATITSSYPGTGQAWNFIGNPYPSPVSWSAIKALNSNITNSSYYVFHTTGQYAGSWGVWNGTTGTTGTYPTSDEIATGQGFFVQSNTTSNNFVMDNTVRTGTSGTGFYSPLILLDNEVRLIITNGINRDEIVTYTDAQATNSYNRTMDAVKMPAGSTVSLAYSLDGNDYAIKVMNNINEQTVLPLTILAQDSGAYTLTATALNTTGLTAYLKDAINNTMVNLSQGPVQLVLNAGQTYSSRYSVVFEPSTTGIANVGEGVTSIYSFGSTVTIERQSDADAVITVTNILGQLVAEIASQTEKTEFDLPTTTPWYAIVKVAEGKKVTVSKLLITQ